MSKKKPGYSHRAVMYLEPSRGKATVGAVIMALLTLGIGAAALVYRTDSWPERWRPDPDVPEGVPIAVAGVMGLFALISILALIVNFRRWRLSRAVERLSNDPSVGASMPVTDWAPPSPVARQIPPLTVDWLASRKFPKSRAKARPVTLERNIFGGRPLEIAYLRLFENRPRTRTFVEGAWREFGYVYLLRSAASVTPAEFKAGKRSGDFQSMFIESPGELLAALDRGDRRPHGKGRHAFRDVSASTLRVRDRYGSYPMKALLCHGSFWKQAIDILLARVDLVALDLSGFTPENAATQHELQRIVDRYPIERVVFLADQRSNRKFLVGQLEQAWHRMAEGSPNSGHQPRAALVAVTDYIATRTSGGTGPGGSGGSQVEVRLVAQRRQTRRLVAMAQARIGG